MLNLISHTRFRKGACLSQSAGQSSCTRLHFGPAPPQNSYMQAPFQEYAERYEVSFIDTSPCINLLAGVPLCSMEMVGLCGHHLNPPRSELDVQLRYDAKQSLDVMMNPDPFSEIFLKDKRGLYSRFDTVIRFVCYLSRDTPCILRDFK